MESEIFKYVLIMDNDINRRNAFYDVLVQSNYKVTTVLSFSNLITIIGKERPDCIIMDMDTLDTGKRSEAIKKLRGVDSGIKVILLVSKLAKGKVNMQKCIDDKIILLNKDMEISQLLQLILRILKEKDVEKKEGEVTFKGNILIVDDEEESVKLVANHLKRKGYNIENAFSGEEALLKIRLVKPKVVILDILMPGLDGLAVLKRIKEIDESIFVIIISGAGSEKIAKEANELGASAYLVKPFNLSKLEAIILSSELGDDIKYFKEFFDQESG